MNYPCIEKTIEVKHGETVVRLWIDITKGNYKTSDGAFAIKTMRECLQKLKTEELIASFLIKTIPNLNAIQIIVEDELQNVKVGKVIYTVPFEDVHG